MVGVEELLQPILKMVFELGKENLTEDQMIKTVMEQVGPLLKLQAKMAEHQAMSWVRGAMQELKQWKLVHIDTTWRIKHHNE
jgi:hypothetical protein